MVVDVREELIALDVLKKSIKAEDIIGKKDAPLILSLKQIIGHAGLFFSFGKRPSVRSASARFCSVQAGFITVRNLLIDGGKCPGAF